MRTLSAPLPFLAGVGSHRRRRFFVTQCQTPDANHDLLSKPSHASSAGDGGTQRTPSLESAIAPFLRIYGSESPTTAPQRDPEPSLPEAAAAGSALYDPQPGDLAVGVVLSGTEGRLDISIGADELAVMLTKEALPLYKEELDSLLCDATSVGEEIGNGRVGVVREEGALEERSKEGGRPVLEPGTVVFAEVLGRTLSGRPLLSARRLFRRVAWYRVRQIMQLNEPIEVKIFEWNTGGLLTRIEGLRAFLPRAEMINRITNFTDLKNNVGRKIHVRITKADEATNELIVSEKEAWELMYLKEGTLLRGTIRQVFPYGVQVRIHGSNRSGLVHISKVSHARVPSINDLLKVDEEVKVLVIKPASPDKIALSIADLETEPGLFLTNKEKVFLEAEEMAKRYRQKLPAIPTIPKSDALPDQKLPFDNEASAYANWNWFKFEQVDEDGKQSEYS